MCGVFGFIGEGRAAPIVLEGLRNLEYRGYDSAGMATIADCRIWCRKDVGKLVEVEARQGLGEMPGSPGIGHVRWATHGGITPCNAHPHTDCAGQIAVVHNGIIENYQELRRGLEARHRFLSDTDTEVIPHLMEDHILAGASLEEALLQAAKQLEGSYALVAITAREPRKLVAMCKDSPLVVGLAPGRGFVASDALSFLEQTRRVVFLEDGEGVVLTKDGATFWDGHGKEIVKEPQEIGWQWDGISKDGYESFMRKEIMEAPGAIRCALVQDRNLLAEIALDILRAKRVVLTACGTSRYAALVGRHLFSRLAGKFCNVAIASEFRYLADAIDRDTLVIAVSQSGETADVLEGVKRAKRQGAAILSLVNTVGSSLARLSDKVLYLNCGPEVSVAATKSFVSQLTLFYLLAFTMMHKLGQGVKKLETLADCIRESFGENGQKLEELAWMTKDASDFYYIARGINYAIAAEGALKLKEVAYIHAEGIPAGELKHGPLALIEKGTPVVVICPKDYTFAETLANSAETKARGAFVIGVSDENNPLFDEWVRLPTVEEIFYPLVAIGPLQLLAYHLAVTRGKDPDRPRNLAKSVTVK